LTVLQDLSKDKGLKPTLVYPRSTIELHESCMTGETAKHEFIMNYILKGLLVMDFSAALPIFAITLREGVEAALVVGIVMAYLKKADRSSLNPWVFGGLGTGVLASFVVGILLNWFLKQVESSDPAQAAFYGQLWQGVLGLMAIAMLSWMLVWMTENAKALKGEIEGQIGKAIANQKTAGWAVFTLIFIAVLREGFEVVIFISAKLQGGLVPIIGAIAG
jgi:high-affinity iron transporter